MVEITTSAVAVEQEPTDAWHQQHSYPTVLKDPAYFGGCLQGCLQGTHGVRFASHIIDPQPQRPGSTAKTPKSVAIATKALLPAVIKRSGKISIITSYTCLNRDAMSKIDRSEPCRVTAESL